MSEFISDRQQKEEEALRAIAAACGNIPQLCADRQMVKADEQIKALTDALDTFKAACAEPHILNCKNCKRDFDAATTEHVIMSVADIYCTRGKIENVRPGELGKLISCAKCADRLGLDKHFGARQVQPQDGNKK